MDTASGAQQAMLAGVEAFRRKDFDAAEPLLIKAFRAYGPADGGRRTAAIHLGFICRQTGRYEDAITALEEGLPFPGAFRELVSIYRFLGKAAKKGGDSAGEAENYGRMYSLAVIDAGVLTVRLPNQPAAVDWSRAAEWIAKIRAKCGTIYAWRFEGREVEGSDLLSPVQPPRLTPPERIDSPITSHLYNCL